MKRNPVILNLNGSIDDNILLWEAMFLKDIDIKLICLSAGNLSLIQVSSNVLQLLEKYNRDIPVVVGVSDYIDMPIDKIKSTQTNGLGGYKYNIINHKHLLTDTSKVIYDTIIANPKIEIICSGLSTNIAKTITEYPDCVNSIGNIFLIGGKKSKEVTFVDPPILPEWYDKCDKTANDIIYKCGCRVTVIPIDMLYNLFITPRQRYYLKNLNSSGNMLSEMFEVYKSDENAFFISPALLACAWRSHLYKTTPSIVDITKDNNVAIYNYTYEDSSSVEVVDKINVGRIRLLLFQMARKARTYEERNND